MTPNAKVAACRTGLLILTVALVSMVLASCGGGVGSGVVFVNTPTPSAVNNKVTVTVGKTSSGGHTNGVFTSVTVCGPAIRPVGQNPPYGPPPAPTCKTIPNILVDTGSVGLRLLETVDVDNLA